MRKIWYTSGPWTYDGIDTIFRPGDRTSDQADICYMNEEGGNEYSEWWPSKDVIDADARLIAAAPELLSLIDGAYEVVELFGYHGTADQKKWANDWLERARKCGASGE